MRQFYFYFFHKTFKNILLFLHCPQNHVLNLVFRSLGAMLRNEKNNSKIFSEQKFSHLLFHIDTKSVILLFTSLLHVKKTLTVRLKSYFKTLIIISSELQTLDYTELLFILKLSIKFKFNVWMFRQVVVVSCVQNHIYCLMGRFCMELITFSLTINWCRYLKTPLVRCVKGMMTLVYYTLYLREVTLKSMFIFAYKFNRVVRKSFDPNFITYIKVQAKTYSYKCIFF